MLIGTFAQSVAPAEATNDCTLMTGGRRANRRKRQTVAALSPISPRGDD
jgi:hypothetical protein